MNQRQISPNGQHDGGGSLLVAILNRVGILVIIVAGVFIAPTGLPEFPSQGQGVDSRSAEAAEELPWSGTERVSRPNAPTPRQNWKVLETARPVIDDAIEIDTPDGIAPALRITASAGETITPDSAFRRVCRRLGSGLRRLVGGFVVARESDRDVDQRIPASFIPSRS